MTAEELFDAVENAAVEPDSLRSLYADVDAATLSPRDRDELVSRIGQYLLDSEKALDNG